MRQPFMSSAWKWLVLKLEMRLRNVSRQQHAPAVAAMGQTLDTAGLQDSVRPQTTMRSTEELIVIASFTDMYTSWPNTGVTVSYNLRIENTTCSPDGSNARTCMLINGRYPGPTIVANWGDTIRVYVCLLLYVRSLLFF
jgi:hypothetical protein